MRVFVLLMGQQEAYIPWIQLREEKVIFCCCCLLRLLVTNLVGRVWLKRLVRK